jgi:aspartate 4-decarboxylase
MEHPTDAERSSGLSPVQLKDELIRCARDFTQRKAATHKFLDAGRGNPNWVATTPREAFFMLGHFAMRESKRIWDEPDLGGMPHADGIADRMRAFLKETAGPGSDLLSHGLDYAVQTLGFEADAFVHELVDGLMGDNYPVPDRMLVHGEGIVQRYLARALCAGRPPEGKLDLFAVEGATAGLCYVFASLMANRVLARGDTIALGTPIFGPYVDLPRLDEYAFHTIEIGQSETVDGRNVWQYPDAELAKLEDPQVKAFLLANPSNPASYAMRARTMDRIVELVNTRRPDLILVTDDVYGTFVDGFRSLAAELPHNTILLYSFSKYFGCTGWRLGVVGLHEHNVVDEAIARLPEADRQRLHQRYGSLVQDPDGLKFIDRVVAESRGVALNHTAGLSLPQQVQMTLFALFALLDTGDHYQARCRRILRERFQALLEALGVELPEDPDRVGYYADLDLEDWGRRTFGEEFTAYVRAHRDPLEILLGLARRHGTVLLNGSGFDGPPWAARVSLANLDTQDYAAIGRDLREIAAKAVQDWQAQDRQTGQ